MGIGHNNPKATGCLDRLLCYWGSKYIRESGSPYWPVKAIRYDSDGFHLAATLRTALWVDSHAIVGNLLPGAVRAFWFGQEEVIS